MNFNRILIITVLSLAISACTSKQDDPLKLAINAWPGYEFLYLADQKGFFEQVGLNVSLLQLGSLADGQRAFLNGYANAMASTMIEAVQSQVLGAKNIKIVLIPDYSNGGDVIIANRAINSISDLKGKTVGCEVSSLGIFILQRALAKAGLTLNDVTIINTEQNMGYESLDTNQIDAFVSYPPISIELLKHPNNHIIFSSAEIPNEIIDVVSISEDYLEQHPDIVVKLHQAWQMALDFHKSNPDEAVRIMAEREGITPQEFNDVLSDLKLLDINEQTALFRQPGLLENSVQQVCQTLNHVGSIEANCSHLPNLIYQGL